MAKSTPVTIAGLKRSHLELLNTCRFALSVQRKCHGLFDASDRLNEKGLDKAIHNAEQLRNEF
jgi:hypothetical protein